MIPYFFSPPDDLSPRRAGAVVSNCRLALRVADRLGDALGFSGREIVVEAQTGVVLDGTVPSADVRQRARRLVWITPGTLDVLDRLRIRTPCTDAA